MQGLAQRLTATRPDRVNSDASFGELAWIWGKGHAGDGPSWRRQLWFSGADLVAWSWAHLPHQVSRSDGFALKRWAAHGYEADLAALGDDGDWTQLNERYLTDVEQPVLPAGFRFRTADEAGPEAAVRAHVDAWAPTAYTAQSYEDVKQTAAYRGDLHVLVEAPDGTMASSTIMWLDQANRTVEFEPVGTHPDYRRLGLARTMMLHGMHLARTAGASHATVVCRGAPGHPAARGLYYGLGFRELSRDAPLIKTKTAD
jgi:ribosomal protein S18 acetylase RimI-like enzyme